MVAWRPPLHPVCCGTKDNLPTSGASSAVHPRWPLISDPLFLHARFLERPNFGEWGGVKLCPPVSMAIHNDLEDWAGVGGINSGERAWLLQSPSVDTDRHLEEDRRRTAGVSLLGAVFIVVNAALGAGLLNFPAAFNMAGGVTAGVMLQMVSSVL